MFSNALMAARRSRAKGKGGRRSGRGKVQRLNVPPAIDCVANFSRTYRFVASNNVTANISVLMLLSIPGCICTVANTTMVTFASSFRLKRVRMWTPETSAGSVANALRWTVNAASGFIKDESKNQSLPGGITTTGVQEYRPPKASTLDDWLASNLATSNVFQIQCVAGAIVDVDICHTVATDIANQPVSIASGTQGTLYYAYLDGSASHLLQPVGVTSFTF